MSHRIGWFFVGAMIRTRESLGTGRLAPRYLINIGVALVVYMLLFACFFLYTRDLAEGSGAMVIWFPKTSSKYAMFHILSHV